MMPPRQLVPVVLLVAAAACGPDYSVVPSPTATIVVSAGNGQTGTAGAALANPVVVLVTDGTGAPASGVSVTWTPGTGSGSVSATATTDAAGHASATWTLGATVGTQTLNVRAAGIGTVVATAVVPAFSAKAVTVGAGFACGLDLLNVARCWGNNPSGVFGDTTLAPSPKPVIVAGAPAFVSIAAGADFVCGLTAVPGNIWCWGSNAHGQRGVSGAPAPAPTLVSGGLTWTDLAAGGQSACGIASDSTAWCWGSNGYGQLGDSTAGTDRLAPVRVAVRDSIRFAALSVSSTHTCGISTSGRLWCWGRNADRELGADSSGSQYDFPLPVATSDTTGFVSVAAGGLHTCARGTTVTYCWGSNKYGQVGNRTISASDDSLPTPMDSTLGLAALAADSASTVALAIGNKAYWWGTRGANLGAPASVDRSLLPKAVPNFTFTAFATGAAVSCGILTNHFVFCWGSSADPNFPATDTPAGVPAP